jgi:hypothetical protein
LVSLASHSVYGCAGALDFVVSTVHFLSLWAGSRGVSAPAGPSFSLTPLILAAY